MSFLQLRSPRIKNPLAIPPNQASAVIAGTVTPSSTEADIVTGGKTITITLTNDTWVASGGTFDGQRQNIINGLDSAQSEGAGWDAVVKATQGVSGVIRTSNTVVTITLDAFASYNITATETITVTIPASSLTGGSAVIGIPTFTITAVGTGTSIKTYKGLATASVKTAKGLAIASRKTKKGLA